ncbi:hypothetical protein [Pediococcus parvulus]|uniref:hypothetical protein n=1 Tax=Pediococcus parvulus TaxID=54062 RepID=UPI000A51A26A|nr:hypothetical protein [Pediococcus parvulus]
MKNKRGMLALMFALFMFLSIGISKATANNDDENDKVKHSVFHARKYKRRKTKKQI